jgi:type IV pilus biogenesis protein PilP
VARPGSAEAVVTEAPPETDAALPGGVALTDLRPPSRPETVAALAPPPPLPSFDGPRPALRPDGLAPEGATSEVPADAPEPVDPQAALAQTLASIVEGAGDPLATATPQAVALARRPEPRPGNFARVVQQQSDRLARATAAAQQQAAPASLGTPEEVAETEAEEVAATAEPSAITPRNVSDAATMANVMALREINLIGVYGTPNDRRALVRLANGRYVRVSVGDSLDGGQVAAIGDNVLNYVRRGRTITLEIPGG